MLYSIVKLIDLIVSREAKVLKIVQSVSYSIEVAWYIGVATDQNQSARPRGPGY